MPREPTVTGRKLGLNSLEQKEKINIQPQQNEETRIQKNEEWLQDASRTTLNVPISES